MGAGKWPAKDNASRVKNQRKDKKTADKAGKAERAAKNKSEWQVGAAWWCHE